MSLDYKQLLIKDFTHWSVYLHQDQTNLGRSYLWSHRQEYIDFLDMADEERDEFFQVAQLLRRSLTDLFKPDLFNYASLANVTRHLHIHCIPRYARPRIFQDITFTDLRWGHGYRSNPKFFVSDEALLGIRDAMRAAFNK